MSGNIREDGNFRFDFTEFKVFKTIRPESESHLRHLSDVLFSLNLQSEILFIQENSIVPQILVDTDPLTVEMEMAPREFMFTENDCIEIVEVENDSPRAGLNDWCCHPNHFRSTAAEALSIPPRTVQSSFKTLQDWIDTDIRCFDVAGNPKISDLMIRTICLDIATLLHCLHAIGFVFRDLKPSNFLIDSSNTKVLMIDFDSVGYIGDQRDVHLEVFTEFWLAPEIRSLVATNSTRNLRYTKKADIFSYSMLVSTIASRSRSLVDEASVDLLHKLTNIFGAEAAGELVRGLAKNPDERPDAASLALTIFDGVRNRSIIADILNRISI